MLRFSSRQAPPAYKSVLRYPGLPLSLKLQCNLRDPGLPTQEFCVDGLTFAAGLHLGSCRLAGRLPAIEENSLDTAGR